jgi:hypothetical protein
MKSILRYTIILLPSVLLLCFVFMYADTAFANERTWWQTLGDNIENALHPKTLLYKLIEVLITIVALAARYFGEILDTIIEFSLESERLSAIRAIEDGWMLIRDILNMSFIFLLLYIAIGTILQISHINTQKMLVSLIMAAILVNFSLFFTQVIIDAGNIVAVHFYNVLSPPGPGTMSTSLVTILEIAGTTFGTNTPLASDISAQDFGLALSRLFILIALVWAFISVALLFLVRVIMFVFLMILSPVGVIGGIIPGLKKYSQQFWSALVNQTLVAPVFLFFLYVIVLIAQPGSGLEIVGTEGSPDTDWLTRYVLIIGTIIAAVKITKNLSGKAGQTVTGFGKTAAGFVTGAALGGAAMLGRGYVGGTAHRLAQNDDLKERAAGGDRMAEAQLRTAQRLSQSTFDLRNTSGIQAFSQHTGIKLGKGTDETYKKGFDRVVKRESDFANTLGYDKTQVANLREQIDTYDNDILLAKQRNDRAGVRRLTEEKLEKEREKKALENSRKVRYAERLQKKSERTSEWGKPTLDPEKPHLLKYSSAYGEAANKLRKEVGENEAERIINLLSSRTA